MDAVLLMKRDISVFQMVQILSVWSHNYEHHTPHIKITFYNHPSSAETPGGTANPTDKLFEDCPNLTVIFMK